MNRKNIYLGMTIVGTLAPVIVGAPYLLEHGFNPAHLIPVIFSTPVSAALGINIIIVKGDRFIFLYRRWLVGQDKIVRNDMVPNFEPKFLILTSSRLNWSI